MAIFRNLYRLFFSRKIYHDGKFSHESERRQSVYASTEEEALSKAKIKGAEFTECSNLCINAGPEKLTGLVKIKEGVNRGGKEKKRK